MSETPAPTRPRPRCTENIFGVGGWHQHQCGAAAKHDPDANGVPTRCGTHSKAAYERRRAAADAKINMQRERDRARYERRDAERAALQEVEALRADSLALREALTNLVEAMDADGYEGWQMDKARAALLASERLTNQRSGEGDPR